MKKQKIMHAGASALEKITGELALPLAALSTTQEGNAFERAYGGIATAAKAAYNGVESYVVNSGVRDTINNAGGELMQMMGNFGSNMAEHPTETLYTALGTYAALKIAPYVSRYARHKSH